MTRNGMTLKILKLMVGAFAFVAACGERSIKLDTWRDRHPGFLIVHITDTHVSSIPSEEQKTPFWHKIIINDFKLHRVNRSISGRNLQKSIRLINNTIKPDLVVVSGDLVDNMADTDGYHQVACDLGRLDCAWLAVMGDHDATEAGDYNRVQHYFSPRPESIEVNGFIVIGLPPFPTPDDLNWLRVQLRRCGNTPVVLVHHRMIVASPLMNLLSKIYCPTLLSSASGELLNIVSQHDNIRAVLTGHAHTNHAVKIHNTLLATTASTAEYPYEIRLVSISGPEVHTKVFSIYEADESMP